MARRKQAVVEAPALPDNTDFLFEGNEPDEEVDAQVASKTFDESAHPEPVVDQPEAEEGQESEPSHQAAEDPNERAISGLRNELIQYRRKARELQESLIERDAREKVLAERLDKLNERWAKAEAPAPPDPAENPADYIVSKVDERFNAFRAEIERKEREQMEAAYVARQREQFVGGIANAEAQFASQNPDYYNAVAHLRMVRAQELAGFGVPEEQIPQIVAQEAVQFAAWTAQNGMNPAEAAYRSALQRGYVQQAPEGQEPAPVQAPPSPGVAKMQTIARGAAASRSLSSTQGGAGKRAITLADLADFSDEDFDKIAENPRLWEALNKGEAVYW